MKLPTKRPRTSPRTPHRTRTAGANAVVLGSASGVLATGVGTSAA